MDGEIKGYGARPVVMGSLRDYLPADCKIKSGLFSRIDIKNHFDKFGVDLSCCKVKDVNEYESFCEYLSREYSDGARPVDCHQNSLISPCDGFLTAYFINSFSMIPLDGHMYSVAKLLGSAETAREFAEGIALVIRPGEADPHRFIYIDDGAVAETSELQEDKNNENSGLFCARTCSLLLTESFYKVAQVEICGNAKGVEQFALEDGRISFSRGQEKGRFLCDNASVVLLFQKGAVHPDDEFMVNTGNDKATRVLRGERIGYVISR